MGLFHYEIGNLATYSSKKEKKKKNKEPSLKKNLDIPFYLLLRLYQLSKKNFLKEAGRGKKRKHSSPSQILFPKTSARGLQIEFEMAFVLDDVRT